MRQSEFRKERWRIPLRLWMPVSFLLLSSWAFASLGSDQPKDVQCGDAATGVWQNSCPSMTSPAPPVTAGGLDTSGTTGAYIDVKWATGRCSSSAVVLMRDANFAPERQVFGDAAGNDGCGAGFAKNHQVHVDHLWPRARHFFYVASQEKDSGKWSTTAGPFIASGSCRGTCKPFVFASPVPDLSGRSNWAIWTYGPQNVDQGHDLLIGLQEVVASGPVSKSTYLPWSSVQFLRLKDQEGNPCKSNCTDTQDGTRFNLDATLICSLQFVNNPATEYANYMADRSGGRDWCYGNGSAIRVRTNCNGHGPDSCGRNTTPAGLYRVSATLHRLEGQNSGGDIGQPFTVTYIYTVRAAATFVANPPPCLVSGNCPAIPCYLATSKTCPSGKDYTWEKRIQYFGPITCTGGAQDFHVSARRQNISTTQATSRMEYMAGPAPTRIATTMITEETFSPCPTMPA